MTIEEYFNDWCNVLDTVLAEKTIRRAIKSGKICPNPNNVFRAFQLCPLSKLRVVIIGQDPYFNLKKDGNPVATGIAFANSSDTPEKSYSPSLEILRESVIDFSIPHGKINFEPGLEKWEEQGVLLLNAALTCTPGKPGSHMLLWRPFMESLLSNLSKQTSGIVYILMGSTAQTFEPYISKEFNHVVRIRHPAYYARTSTRMPSGIWKEVNDILIAQNGYGIKWFEEY